MNRTSIIAFTAGAATTLAATALIATGPDDHKHHDTHAHDAPHAHDPMDMDPQAMMEAWMELGTPGKIHEKLMKDVGTWDAHTKFAMDPSQPDVWTESKGKCVVKPMLDGRFIESTFTMDFMGMPFKGIAINGYDNGRGCYVSTWVDSMSTQIMHMTGNLHDDGTLVMEGKSFMPGMGEYNMRIVYDWESENEWSETFYDQMPDGSWFNSGVITFTRR